jgi:hypothetical protein
MKTMKIFRSLLVAAVAIAPLACDEGIDPITRVDPGPDNDAPTVQIKFPKIRVKEDVTPLTIDFEVTDDIEIQSIAVSLNGTQIKEFSNFKDYRRALGPFEYPELASGVHTLTITAKDLSGKSTSASVNFEKVEPYQPVYEGEIFYLPFDGDYFELVSATNVTKVGSPLFADDAVAGSKSYKGFADAYLTFPTEGLLGEEFSAAFWYKVNASPDRSGILTVSPPDPNNTANPNNRTKGFRLFRENAGGKQRVKLNVGSGSTDHWFDGGANADIDPSVNEWVHIAFTISQTKAAVYINGEIVSEGTLPNGVSWADCDILSIASGAPRFTEWGHLSDQSLYDELRFFNKALTQDEVQDLMGN